MKFPFTTRKRLAGANDTIAQQKVKLNAQQEHIGALKLELAKAKEKNRAGFPSIRSGVVDPRKTLATALQGEGIEIGALHFPLKVPSDVKVRYVDMATREENIRRFPELDPAAIVETGYVCNGETLEVIPDGSQDFVIANHMLEHCINPLATLRNFLRVLKPSGQLFISLPDKRYTFDEKRAITPFHHIAEDFSSGRTVEDLSVYEEWVSKVELAEKGSPQALHETQENIHFHVWTQLEILEMFIEARRLLGFPIEIEWAAKNGIEFIVLLRKTEAP